MSGAAAAWPAASLPVEQDRETAAFLQNLHYENEGEQVVSFLIQRLTSEPVQEKDWQYLEDDGASMSMEIASQMNPTDEVRT